MRQRYLVRADILAHTTAKLGHLETLGMTFQALAMHLRQRWHAE